MRFVAVGGVEKLSVLINRLSFQARAKQYADVIAKALNFVKTNLDDSDIYSLAIACYAAQLANDSSKTIFMQKLDKFAIIEGMNTPNA